MLVTLATLLIIAAALLVSRWWWPSPINPLTLGILAWTPALLFFAWPPYFLSPIYIHLNLPPTPLVYLAMAMAFLSCWLGFMTVKSLSRPDAFDQWPERLRLDFDTRRAMLLFAIGLAIFIYSFVFSGLLDIRNLDDQQVAESRLALHLGAISVLVSLMDIIAIAMFTRFVQRGGWINLLPMLIALLCQGATLQKSRFIFLIIACVFVMILNPGATRRLLWQSFARRILAVVGAFVILVSLLIMNAARGIAVVQMTAADTPLYEQIYIYSGAAAIQNVSVTLDGYLPSDPPAYGLYLLRPIFWHIVDRDQIFATRYFEGINAATYMIYGWADFRWLGFILTPFVTGVIIMLALRAALRGSLVGLIMGVVATQALILSVNTDVIFDPTTAILIALAFAADWFIRERRKAPQPQLYRPGPHRAEPPRTFGA